MIKAMVSEVSQRLLFGALLFALGVPFSFKGKRNEPPREKQREVKAPSQ